MDRFGFYSLCFIGLTATVVRGLSLASYDDSVFQGTKCVEECQLGGEMICGSDGNTYPSVCHLSKHACETKTALKIDHPGSCECPTTCQKNYKPVCAITVSSGKEKTFPNMCQLRKTACQMKLNDMLLKFSRKGPCKKMSKCPSGCRDIFAPVCGGDNKTYSSVCALKIAACKANKKISLIRISRCKPGSCPENCPLTYQPICGNDGKIYPSECEMKLTACRNGKVVKVVKRKKAKKLCGRKCVIYCTEDVAPVCGSDGYTYVNECRLMKKNCDQGLRIKIVKRETCGQLSNNFSKK